MDEKNENEVEKKKEQGERLESVVTGDKRKAAPIQSHRLKWKNGEPVAELEEEKKS